MPLGLGRLARVKETERVLSLFSVEVRGKSIHTWAPARRRVHWSGIIQRMPTRSKKSRSCSPQSRKAQLQLLRPRSGVRLSRRNLRARPAYTTTLKCRPRHRVPRVVPFPNPRVNLGVKWPDIWTSPMARFWCLKRHRDGPMYPKSGIDFFKWCLKRHRGTRSVLKSGIETVKRQQNGIGV
jgi:hypothetical protein